MSKETELFKELSDAVVDMQEDLTKDLSEKAVSEGYDAYKAIDSGLSDGMARAGVLFEEGEYFVPELILCSDAMYGGINILRPHIKKQTLERKYKVVLGVMEGDTHDIGKNLVKIMLDAAGFEIIDLGRDVPPESFVRAAKENQADFIALSTLMTTTMDAMSDVIALLEKENIRRQFKVIVGGGPVSEAFAKKIGADGYADNAAEAVRLVRKLIAEVTAGVAA
ncbi:MAG: corrinoid protein [Deltaproteobacteria bacterium]|nr:corrinoid protein [Deltaproteobacteria bacterium]